MGRQNMKSVCIAAAFIVASVGIAQGITCYDCGRRGEENCPGQRKQNCMDSKYCAWTKASIAGKPEELGTCDTEHTVEWFNTLYREMELHYARRREMVGISCWL